MFDTLDENVSGGLLRFVQDFATDDTRPQAVSAMFEQLGLMLGVDADRLQTLFEDANDADEDLSDLTPEQIRKLAREEFDARDAEERQQKLESDIAQALDEAVGPNDPQQWVIVQHYMLGEGLEASEAVAKYKEDRASYEAAIAEKAIAEYLEAKSAQGGVTAPAAGIAPAVEAPKPKNREERRQLITEQIAALRAQASN